MPTLLALLIQHGVVVVFAFTLAARIGLPLPVSPLLVIAGGLAATGAVSWPATAAMVLAAVAANTAGAELWFLVGRRYGWRVMRWLCRISMSPDTCVQQSESLISRWGGSALLASQFIPGLATVAAPMAGALHMAQRRFLAYQAAGSVLWVAVYLALGVAFHRQIAAAIDFIADAGVAATTIAAILVLAWLAIRYARRRSALSELAMPRITPEALRERLHASDPPIVIDVRGEAARQIDPSTIAGALALDAKTLRRQAPALPHDALIVVYCNCPNDVSAAHATRYLLGHGFRQVMPLAGGLDAWKALDEAASPPAGDRVPPAPAPLTPTRLTARP